MYVTPTSVCAQVLDESKTVKAYKSLSQVEQAFRCYKTIDLKVSPIYHRGCLLAYYVELHRQSEISTVAV